MTSISSSLVAFLKFLIPLPSPSRICGSLPAPKMISTMTKMTIGSGSPIHPSIFFPFDLLLDRLPRAFRRPALCLQQTPNAHGIAAHGRALVPRILAEVHGNRTHHGHLCPSLDLKSRRPTRTCPLPKYKLMDFLFKVNLFNRYPFNRQDYHLA